MKTHTSAKHHCTKKCIESFPFTKKKQPNTPAFIKAKFFGTPALLYAMKDVCKSVKPCIITHMVF